MNGTDPSRVNSRIKHLAALVVLVAVCLTACTSTPGHLQTADADKQELEKEKLALEIERLRLEQRFFVLNRWVGITGGLLGSLAVLWTIAQGYRTLRHQVETQRAQRIAELLTSLSDERAEVRVGAARGLSRYTDAVLGELLSALKLEESPQVRRTIVDTLARVGDKGVSRVIAANANTLPMRAYYLGRLSQAGAAVEYAEALLQLSPRSRQFVRRQHSSQYDHGRRFQRQRRERAKRLRESEAEQNLALVNAAAQEARLAEGAAQVIAQLLRDGRKPKNLEAALDLSSTNLYRADLSESHLSHSLLSRCLMRHVRLDNASLMECDLSHSDLYDASLVGADLSGSVAVGLHLRSSVGRGASLCQASLEDAILSESDLREVDFREANATRAQFRGANLRNARLDASKLNQAEFQGADLREASLRDARCYRVNFIEADLTGACLASVKLGGADLRGAVLRNADLRDADLSGADVGQADFRGADVTGIILRKTRNVERATFDPGVDLTALQGTT